MKRRLARLAVVFGIMVGTVGLLPSIASAANGITNVGGFLYCQETNGVESKCAPPATVLRCARPVVF